jgi:hypothetical protein
MKDNKNQSFSRRTFLSTETSALATGLLYGLSGAPLASGIQKSHSLLPYEVLEIKCQ